MNRVVVIGTSAGGIEALRAVVSALPSDFPAPICVVMHTAPQAPGVLHEILDRATPLTAVSPKNNDRLKAGHIYVAPPDSHLVLEPGRLRVTKGPKENRFRPAIDPLFRSAAQVYGPAAIGVVLTGNLDDGTAGLWAIKQLGGTAIVQDPDDAMFPSMPQSALSHINVDYCVALDTLPPLLVELTRQPADDTAPRVVPAEVEIEVKIAKQENPIDAGLERVAEPSSFACPECHGVLLQMKEANRIRFRCHTGHAYSTESLLAAISEGIEDSLWVAIRALEEAGLLMHRLADHLEEAHNGAEVQRLIAQGQEARKHSDMLRHLVEAREPLAVGQAAGAAKK